MAQSLELGAGEAAELSGECYLDVRLIGAASGVRLHAVTEDDQDIAELRHVDSEVTIRPSGAAGTIRIVAVPSRASAFEPGTRFGVELAGGAGAIPDGPHIVISQSDAGGYQSLDLAQVFYAPRQGWQIRAGGDSGFGDFAYLNGAKPLPPAVDEREYPWIGRGRYAVRHVQSGLYVRPTGQTWSLIVDSSASMRPLLGASPLAASLELVAGCLLELTGRWPEAIGVTGRSRPAWLREAITEPAQLVPLVLSGEPASWSLALPAVTAAVSGGASLVVLLSDGAPADLDEVPRFLEQNPQVTLLFVVAEKQAPEPAGHSQAGLSLDVWSFHQLAEVSRALITGVAVGSGGLADDDVARQMSVAVSGVRA